MSCVNLYWNVSLVGCKVCENVLTSFADVLCVLYQSQLKVRTIRPLLKVRTIRTSPLSSGLSHPMPNTLVGIFNVGRNYAGFWKFRIIYDR